MNRILTLPRPLASGVILAATLALAGTAAAPITAAQTISAAESTAFQEIVDGGATVKIQQNVDSKGKLKITGSGWLNESNAGSTVTIKLNHVVAGIQKQYTRSGDKILMHPGTENQDATIWAQTTAGADGRFELSTDLPELSPGQKLTVNLASGLVAGDIPHAINTDPLTVGGIAYEKEDGDIVECVPSTTKPAVQIVSGPTAAGILKLAGTGWCNKLSGGAVVAFKIDEGGLSRTDDSLHNNRTIFGIVQADDKTGDWEYEFKLPDGTNGPNGSSPAFEPGEHTLRFLSGSMQDGDPVVSLPGRGETLSFVLGDYKPNGFADPLEYSEDLSNARKNGVKLKKSGNNLKITVPGTEKGDWVYLNAYNEAGTPLLPWQGTWFQVDGAGTFTAPLSGISLAGGDYKMVVQSGNQDTRNELLGWAWHKVPKSDSESETIDTSDLIGIASEIEGAVATVEQLDQDIENYRANRNPQAATETLTAEDSPAEDYPAEDYPAEELLQDEDLSMIAAPFVESAALTPAASSVASVPMNSAGGVTAVNAPVAATNLSEEVIEESRPAPDTNPDAPVQAIEDLNEDNVGEITGSLDGELLSLTMAGRDPGDWVYLHIYAPEPVAVGWVQVDADRTVRLDTTTIPNGAHKVAVLGEDGEILGWVEITLGADQLPLDSVQASNTTTPDRTNVLATASSVGSTDWWMIGAGALIPVLYGLSLWAVNRRPRTVKI